MRSLLLALVASAGLIGCVGDVSDMPSGDLPDEEDTQTDNNPANGDLTAAKMAFDRDVFPVINAKCSGAACHAQAGTSASLTKFVATNPADGHTVATQFTALVGNFAASAAPILTLIKPGTHKGMTYTPAEEQKIVAWLDLEVAARNGAGTNPNPQPMGETLSQATERVLSAFHGCMQLTDFQAANMAQAWGNLNAQNNQQCKDCHANCDGGFCASPLVNDFYSTFSKKYYFLQYFTVDLTKGAAEARVLINQVSFQGVANGQDPHREHPRFNATNNNGMAALNQFYQATMTRVNTAGACQPKPLENN